VGNKLFAGIDVSLGNNQLCLMDADGSTVGKSLSFTNNLHSTWAMVDHLNTIVKNGDFESLTIGIEATSLYWFPLFSFLSSEAAFGNTQTQVLSLILRLSATFAVLIPIWIRPILKIRL